MVWLAVVAVLLLLVYSAGFRRFALGLLAFFVVVGVVVYLYEENQRIRSRMLISPEEVQLEITDNSSSRKLLGRIKNNSTKYSLRSVHLKITLRDCEKQKESSEESCTIVAETTETIFVKIPPSQARDFSEHMSGLSSVNPRGKIVWSYTITELTGEEPT